MSRPFTIGRIRVDLDAPCRTCRRPLPDAVTADGFSTHPSCDLKPPYRQP